METYFAYLRWCQNFNEINLIDPAHDKMEWNHTLPRCLFKGHGSGQWLTLKQHAIATALQTLAFGHPCLCGWHKQHLPEWLWDLAIASVHEKISSRSRKTALKKMEQGVGLFNPENFLEYCRLPSTPKQKEAASRAISQFWSELTPEERSARAKIGADAAAKVHRKRVLVTFPDGTEKIFETCEEARQVVGVGATLFWKMKKTGVKSSKGYFARNLDE